MLIVICFPIAGPCIVKPFAHPADLRAVNSKGDYKMHVQLFIEEGNTLHVLLSWTYLLVLHTHIEKETFLTCLKIVQLFGYRVLRKIGRDPTFGKTFMECPFLTQNQLMGRGSNERKQSIVHYLSRHLTSHSACAYKD